MRSQPNALRADARRNIAGIRAAALVVFREHGLGAALDEVARAAGVSKGTIYHRFGGRHGLVDSVVDELVAEQIAAVLDEAQEIRDARTAFATYLTRIWMLQFDEPAVNDVLLQNAPDSPRTAELCSQAKAGMARLLHAAHEAGAVSRSLDSAAIELLIRERGIIAREFRSLARADYERCIGVTLAGVLSPASLVQNAREAVGTATT